MTEKEFINLKTGDMVVLISHGNNKGKMGVVKEIKRDNFGMGTAYLEPYQCEFKFTNPRRTNKDGLYGFNNYSIGYPKKPNAHNKEFYVATMFGEDVASWSADKFTVQELKVVKRFLEELNEYASGLTIDCVAIINKGDDYETPF